MNDFVDDMIVFLVEHVITPPGQWVLEQFGVRRPHEIGSLFTGLAFGAFVVLLVFAVVLGGEAFAIRRRRIPRTSRASNASRAAWHALRVRLRHAS